MDRNTQPGPPDHAVEHGGITWDRRWRHPDGSELWLLRRPGAINSLILPPIVIRRFVPPAEVSGWRLCRSGAAGMTCDDAVYESLEDAVRGCRAAVHRIIGAALTQIEQTARRQLDECRALRATLGAPAGDSIDDDRDLLLRALCKGVAGCLRFPHSGGAEIAVSGLRHAVLLRADGVPVLTAQLRGLLFEAIAKAAP